MRGPPCLLVQVLKHRMQFLDASHVPNRVVSIDCSFAYGPHFCELTENQNKLTSSLIFIVRGILVYTVETIFSSFFISF